MPQYDMFRAYELCLSPSASPGAIGEALVGDPLGSAARAAVGATHTARRKEAQPVQLKASHRGAPEH